jgi:hypothetical protein
MSRGSYPRNPILAALVTAGLALTVAQAPATGDARTAPVHIVAAGTVAGRANGPVPTAAECPGRRHHLPPPPVPPSGPLGCPY